MSDVLEKCCVSHFITGESLFYLGDGDTTFLWNEE
jgi:hypothetical protein